jgi:hypothetical protein
MSAYTHAEDWCLPVGGILYQSIRPLLWEVGVMGSGLIVTVPAGTVFDVSIPQPKPRPDEWRHLPFWAIRQVTTKILNRVFSPHDPHYLKAAALHDEMLRRGWARTTAGAEFHEALKADKVAIWRRLVMWLAVSLFKYR